LAANKILREKSFLRVRRPFTTLLSQARRINEMGGTWQPNIVPSSLKSCTNSRRKANEENGGDVRPTFVHRARARTFRTYVCMRVNAQNTHTTDRHVWGGPKHDHYSTAPTFPAAASGGVQITSSKEHRSLHEPTIRQRRWDRVEYRCRCLLCRSYAPPRPPRRANYAARIDQFLFLPFLFFPPTRPPRLRLALAASSTRRRSAKLHREVSERLFSLIPNE